MRKILLLGFTLLLVSWFAIGAVYAKGPGKGFGRGAKKERGNVVSQAVHKAQAEDLKGKDIAAAAHEAIEEREEGKEEKSEREEKIKEKHHKMHKGHKKHTNKVSQK